MVDEIFGHPRLAALYDLLDGERDDLDAYLGMVEEFGARRVLDIGCGTGAFALLLADRGLEVVGVDPARASLDVARRKTGAERVRWLDGDATDLPPLRVDLATMTGNAAQTLTDQETWHGTLRGAYGALRPGGRLVFETRDPARRAWEEWNREATHRVTPLPDGGAVENWLDVTDVSGPFVTFRWTLVFDDDGQVLVSDSTLRFRERAEVAADLEAAGFAVEDVRGAPDRPGRELVFVARRKTARPPAAPSAASVRGHGSAPRSAGQETPRRHR
ncbi:class I SAM-dependent methyltransferase [Streptomyces sp. NPDC057877]|uniref:class I SAM-dependent methyltransferase n=1 Tax=Streptomyces sp. NPDC057877 TaxID=3346269 RepID=UPI0036A71E5F